MNKHKSTQRYVFIAVSLPHLAESEQHACAPITQQGGDHRSGSWSCCWTEPVYMYYLGRRGRGVGNGPVSHASYGSPCFMFQWQIARLKNGSEINGADHRLCAFRKMSNVPRQCATLINCDGNNGGTNDSITAFLGTGTVERSCKTKGTELLAQQRQCGGKNGRRCRYRMCPSCGMCPGPYGNSIRTNYVAVNLIDRLWYDR